MTCTCSVPSSSTTLPACSLSFAGTRPTANNTNSQITASSVYYILYPPTFLMTLQVPLAGNVQHHHPRELQALWPHSLGSGIQSPSPARRCPTYAPYHLYPITPDQRIVLVTLLQCFCSHNNSSAAADDYSDAQRKIDDDEDIEPFDDGEVQYDTARDPTNDDIPSSPLHNAIQLVILSLFRHEQKGRTTDKFFSLVILYIVLSSIKLDGGLILANSIMQRIAHLTYSRRSAIMLEIERLLAAHPDWNFHTYIVPPSPLPHLDS
jgi:hypothetical protein